MKFKTLAEEGKKYLSQLDEERKEFIIKNNALQHEAAEKFWKILLDESKMSEPPELGVDEKNILKHIEKSPEKKNTDDPK